MASETYLDLCFVQKATGTLATHVQTLFEQLFNKQRLHWYLDSKEEEGIEIVVAEVKGMSRWNSEQDVLNHLEETATDQFWNLLMGYQFQVIPATKGCCKSGKS